MLAHTCTQFCCTCGVPPPLHTGQPRFMVFVKTHTATTVGRSETLPLLKDVPNRSLKSIDLFWICANLEWWWYMQIWERDVFIHILPLRQHKHSSAGKAGQTSRSCSSMLCCWIQCNGKKEVILSLFRTSDWPWPTYTSPPPTAHHRGKSLSLTQTMTASCPEYWRAPAAAQREKNAPSFFAFTPFRWCWNASFSAILVLFPAHTHAAFSYISSIDPGTLYDRLTRYLLLFPNFACPLFWNGAVLFQEVKTKTDQSSVSFWLGLDRLPPTSCLCIEAPPTPPATHCTRAFPATTKGSPLPMGLFQQMLQCEWATSSALPFRLRDSSRKLSYM